jgi:hypothetical protein
MKLSSSFVKASAAVVAVSVERKHELRRRGALKVPRRVKLFMKLNWISRSTVNKADVKLIIVVVNKQPSGSREEC